MHYGFPSSTNNEQLLRQLTPLAETLRADRNGNRPYVEVQEAGTCAGVRIRGLSHLTEQELTEVATAAETIYRKVRADAFSGAERLGIIATIAILPDRRLLRVANPGTVMASAVAKAVSFGATSWKRIASLILTLALVLLGTLGLPGCVASHGRPTAAVSAPDSPALLLVAVDVSGSESPPLRRDYCRLLNAVVDSMPPRTEVRVWNFGPFKAPDSVFDRPVSDGEDLASVEKWIVSHPVAETGTFFEPVAKEFVAVARNAGGRRITCLVLSDGMWDDIPLVGHSVGPLAALPNVKAFWVAPVDPEGSTRSDVTRSLGAFGTRLLVSNRFDLEGGIRRVRDLSRN